MKSFYARSKNKGSIMIMTMLSALVLLGMTALVTDVGYLYYHQARLQTAVNAGWKAGYDRLVSLTGSGRPPTNTQIEEVRSHVLEIMSVNGYTPSELTSVDIEVGAFNQIRVASTQSLGLFFARLMDFEASNVSASRENHALDSGQGVVPLAIPHGVVKDLSRNVFHVGFFGENDGFKENMEYILKLGSGGGNLKVAPELTSSSMIFIPMDNEQTMPIEAYGVIFWCLRIDNSDPGTFVPALWLTGYRGGSFLLPYDPAIITRLGAIPHTVIHGEAEIQKYYDYANPNIVELFVRPRIAVYSNLTIPSPIEEVLIQAQIPYGAYSIPDNNQSFFRGNYNASRNTRTNDAAILNGALNNYHVVFAHNEDLTGFGGGCSYHNHSCKTFLDNGRLGALGNRPARNNAKARMCAYCGSNYDAETNAWLAGYDGEANCQVKHIRCAERKTAAGALWRDDRYIEMCGLSTTSQCSNYLTLRSQATSLGYTGDPDSEFKPRKEIDPELGTIALSDNEPGWFDLANPVQKMKWDVARMLAAHVDAGGHLYAQSFSAETLNLALWQHQIYQGVDPVAAFSKTVGLENFSYKGFPARGSTPYFSSINSRLTAAAQPFELLAPLNSLCQNFGSEPSTSLGSTSSFSENTLKMDTVVLGRASFSDLKYITGSHGYGNFVYMGGDQLLNTESKRLVLNNILHGALVEKTVANFSIEPLAGKQKSNYGPVDPDNVVGGGANDYRDRFIYGFNAPLAINDRLITEPGNQRGPTDQAVEARINGIDGLPPSRKIIIPITDVPPEVKSKDRNGNASTVYDVQGKDNPGGVYTYPEFDFESAVRIIGFAEFEVLDPSEYTRDGENYESGDAGDLGGYQPGQVRGKFLRYIVKPGDIALN